MWTLIGCPFDVVKTRLQTARPPFESPLHCFLWTIRREGLSALWKGFLPQLLVSTPYSVVMFGVYEGLKPQLNTQDGADNYIALCVLAGAASGVAVTAIHNPLELWRVRVQTHLADAPGGRTNTGVLRGLLLRPWQLGRGGSMTLLENVVGNGVFFGSNEAKIFTPNIALCMVLTCALFARQLMKRWWADSSGDSVGWSHEAIIGALT